MMEQLLIVFALLCYTPDTHTPTNQSKSTENIKIYIYIIHTSCHNLIWCLCLCVVFLMKHPHILSLVTGVLLLFLRFYFSFPVHVIHFSFSLFLSLFSPRTHARTHAHNTDSAFTERILGLPNENFKGYVEADATQRARHIPSHSFFLLHGLADSSVPYLHGTQLARALAKAGIIFQYQVSIELNL